jgi:tetratricopeptide (TPR) repeat protein
LDDLESAGIIRLVGLQPEVEYQFRHALIQDAAYSSLLRRQRAAWHRTVAESLEDLYDSGDPGVSDSLAPVLAHHYAGANLPNLALRFYAQAGEAAYARYANAEAALYFERAVLLAVDERDCDPAELRRLVGRLGRSLELSGQPTAALRIYERMETHAQQRHDPALLLAVLMARATILSTASFVHDEAGAQAALERASVLARDLDDHAAEVHINWTLLLRNATSGGNPHERLRLGEAAVRSARALGLPDQLAYVLSDVWYAYAGLGRWRLADQALSEAQSLLRTLSNPALLSEVISRRALNRLVAGDFASALEHAAEAYAVAEQMDSPHMRGLSRVFAGQAHMQRGESAAGLALMLEVVSLGEQTGNITALIGTRADLALAYGILGDLETGLAVALQAIEAGRNRFELILPWPRAAAARLLIQQGRLAEAQAQLAGLNFDELRTRIGFMVSLWGYVGLALIELSLAQDAPAEAAGQASRLLLSLSECGLLYLRPETLLLRAQARANLGELIAAREDLDAALNLAQDTGARQDLWRILANLAQLSERCGEPAAAFRFRQAARAEVEWLAARAPASLCARFLARPPVAALMTPPGEATQCE